MKKMRSLLRAAMLLTALILCAMTMPGLAESVGKADYTGLWVGEGFSLMLYEDGTGIWGRFDDVSRLTWRLKDNSAEVKVNGSAYTHRLKLTAGSRDTAEIMNTSVAAATTYILNRGEARDHTGFWVDEPDRLYLLENGEYVLYHQDLNEEGEPYVYHAGHWLEGGKAVYLLDDADVLRFYFVDDGAGLKKFWGSERYVRVEADVSGSCYLCDGQEMITEDCAGCSGGEKRCSLCRGSGFASRCASCSGTGQYTYKTTSKCWQCSGFGWNPNCSTCYGKGTYTVYSKDVCLYCEGTGGTFCKGCSGTGGVVCDICGGQGSAVKVCRCCDGSGLAPTPTPRPTVTPRATATPTSTPTPTPKPTRTPGPRVSFTQKNGASCSGAAWNSAVPACGKDVLKQLSSDYALEITFSAAGNGHVWICLPQSQAGWTGIGQQNPILQGNTVIIPYDAVVKAAGSSSSWGNQLYIKGSTDWKVTQIRVIYWPD